MNYKIEYLYSFKIVQQNIELFNKTSNSLINNPKVCYTIESFDTNYTDHTTE